MIDAIDMINAKLATGEMTKADLLAIMGTRARISEVLNRRRPLTLNMIRKLHQRHKISASILIAEYETIT